MMHSYSNLIIGALSPLDLSGNNFAAQELCRILERYDWARPTYVGHEEPLRERYLNPVVATSSWADPFLWKNKASGLEGSIWFGRGVQHSCAYLRMRTARFRPRSGREASRLLIELAAHLQADFGYIHLIRDADLNSANDRDYERLYSLDVGLTTRDLRKGVPLPCWAMLFGSSYAEMFPSLLSLPPPVQAQSMEWNNARSVYVQLTSTWRDLLDARSEIERSSRMFQEACGSLLASSPEAVWVPEFRFPGPLD